MALADVCSKALILLLSRCSLGLQLFTGVLCLVLVFVQYLPSALSSFAIISLGKRELVGSVSLSLSHWYPASGVVLDCIDS